MENYQLVQQWASKITAEKAFDEMERLRLKYPWLKCDESFQFISEMKNDLPKILNIIKLQERQNTVLREKNRRNEEYIRVNGLADECILNDLKAKFGIDI